MGSENSALEANQEKSSRIGVVVEGVVVRAAIVDTRQGKSLSFYKELVARTLSLNLRRSLA